jgi:uncharacterized protein (TIRG00374 family)
MWRKLLYLILSGLLIWYFWHHWKELEKVGETIHSGTWYWVVAAVFLQIFHYLFHAFAIKRSFRALQIKWRGREILPASLAALAVNVIAPSMNISGMAYLVDAARRRGLPTTGALVATGVTVIVDGVVFTCFALGVGLVLFGRGGLSTALLTSILVLLGIILFFVVSLTFFWRHPDQLERWLFFVGKKRKDHWVKEWNRVTKLPLKIRTLVYVLLPEIAAHFCNFGSLCFIFAAFHQDGLGLQPAIAYTVGVLFVILSPTPMGIGFAESGMAVAMLGQGVPLASATAIAIAYRGLSFWIPFIIGAVILHYLHINTVREEYAQQN